MYDISKIILSDFNFETLEQARQYLQRYNEQNADLTVQQQIQGAPIQFAQLASSRAQIQRLLPQLQKEQFSALESDLVAHFHVVQENFARLEAAEQKMQGSAVEIEASRDLENILECSVDNAVKIIQKYQDIASQLGHDGTREKILISVKLARTRLMEQHGVCCYDFSGPFGPTTEQRLQSLVDAGPGAATRVGIFAEEFRYLLSGLTKLSLDAPAFRKYENTANKRFSYQFMQIIQAATAPDIFFGYAVKIYFVLRAVLKEYVEMYKKTCGSCTFQFSAFIDRLFGNKSMLLLENDSRTLFSFLQADADARFDLESRLEESYQEYICDKLAHFIAQIYDIMDLIECMHANMLHLERDFQASAKSVIASIFDLFFEFLLGAYKIGERIIMLSHFEEQILYLVLKTLRACDSVELSANRALLEIQENYLLYFLHVSNIAISAACFLYYDVPPLNQVDFYAEFAQNYKVEDYQAQAQIFDFLSKLQMLNMPGVQKLVLYKFLERYIKIAEFFTMDSSALMQRLFSMFECYFQTVKLIISKSTVYYSSVTFSKLQRLASPIEVLAVVKNRQYFYTKGAVAAVLGAISGDLENIFNYLLPISVVKLSAKISYEINQQLQQKYEYMADLDISDVIARQQLIYQRFFETSSLLNPDATAYILGLGEHYNPYPLERTDFYLLVQGKEGHPMLYLLFYQFHYIQGIIQQQMIHFTSLLIHRYFQSFMAHIHLTQDLVIDNARISTFRGLTEEVENYLERSNLGFEKWIGLRELSATIQALIYNRGFVDSIGNFDLIKQFYTLVDCEFAYEIYSETQVMQIYIIVHCFARVLKIGDCYLNLLVKRSNGQVTEFSENLFDKKPVQDVVDYFYGLLINFIY